jgi:hypothetical protein
MGAVICDPLRSPATHSTWLPSCSKFVPHKWTFSVISRLGWMSPIRKIQQKSKLFFNTDRLRFKNAKIRAKEERKIKREDFLSGEAVHFAVYLSSN